MVFRLKVLFQSGAEFHGGLFYMGLLDDGKMFALEPVHLRLAAGPMFPAGIRQVRERGNGNIDLVSDSASFHNRQVRMLLDQDSA